MANTFKNFGGAVTTGGNTLYTAPTGVTSIVLHLQAANVDGATSADLTSHWTDSSNSNAVCRLGSLIPVGPKSAIPIVVGKLALEPGDTLVFTASADSIIEISGTVLEMSS